MPSTTEATSPGAGAESTLPWYEEFYGAMEAKDIDTVCGMCTEDTRVQFANHEPVSGRHAVREVMLHFWGSIERMHHGFTHVLESGDQATLEADVTYTRLDGSLVVIKSGTVIRRQDGLIADQRIYVDLSPLFAGSADPEQAEQAGEGAAA
jgi:ketosteroid isomerase-like protein